MRIELDLRMIVYLQSRGFVIMGAEVRERSKLRRVEDFGWGSAVCVLF